MNNYTPIGTILMFSGKKIPYGWMLCDGRKLSQTVLSSVFKKEVTTDINQSFKKLKPLLAKGAKLPDLRNRFVVGTGNRYKKHQTGEPDTHTHRVNPPLTVSKTTPSGKHSHKFPTIWYPRKFVGISQNYSAIDTAGDDIDNATTQEEGNHEHEVVVDFPAFNSGRSSGRNRPVWYALCYIMKVLE